MIQTMKDRILTILVILATPAMLGGALAVVWPFIGTEVVAAVRGSVTGGMEWLSIVSDVSVTGGVLMAALTYAFNRRRGASDDVLRAVSDLRDELRRDIDGVREGVRDVRGEVREVREGVDDLRREVAYIDKRLAVVEVRLDERAAARQSSTEPPPSEPR